MVEPQNVKGLPPSNDDIAVSGSSAPPWIDPIELEQFRQYQNYQRFTQASAGSQVASTPPRSALPHRREHRHPMPRWLSWLIKKAIVLILIFAMLAAAGTWLYHHFFPGQLLAGDKYQDTTEYVKSGGGKYHTNHVLPTDLFQAVRAIYDAIGKPDSQESKISRVCLSMTEEAQSQFAHDLGYPDCATAVPALSAKVTDMNSYIYAVRVISGVLPAPDMITVHSCWYDIQGGPQLGSFTLAKVEMGQWLITGHANEPAVCPAPPTSR